MLAAARLSDCAVLLSEDFQHGRDFARVRVTNPFKKQPETESR